MKRFYEEDNEKEEQKQILVNPMEQRTYNRHFEWKDKFFDNINRTTFNFARRLVDSNLIKDVYLDEYDENGAKIVIEYFFKCKDDLHNITRVIDENNESKIPTSKRPFEKFKLPYGFQLTANAGCKQKKEYTCEFYGCPVIIAGYLYHMTKNLKRDVIDPNKLLKKEVKEEKKESLKDILTPDLLSRRKDIIQEINDNIYLDNNIKEEFCRLIRALDNYDKFKDSLDYRPNLNYAFTDNTDTIHRLCVGQEEYINQYLSILKYFNIIDGDEKPKIVDFKELTEKDFLNDKEKNYKEKVIILKNIYLLSVKDNTEITNDRQLNISIIKTTFPSFIATNSNDKIFIICDKVVNVKNFYSNYNQLQILFNTINIAPLKIDDIYTVFMKKIKNPKYNIELEPNFENNFKEYLKIHYPYSPYQNLEFVRYLFNSAVSDSLNTSHPGVLKVEDFHVFKTDKLEGESALNELVGLDSVKEEVRNLKNFLAFKNEKESLGEKMPKIDLHMVYLGNPGTGKTTVARMMADILFNMGYIRYNKCLETEAKDFIANIPGATAMKTSEKIQEALGGVLFIDEAYALGESEYGKECIAALIKSMEDFRDDLVIILAGYDNEMNRFLEINSGFKSRVAYYFNFKDYSNEELYQMFEFHFTNYGFEIRDNETRHRINQLCDLEKRKTSFGNGRFVRQKVDEILRKHAINSVDETDEEIKNHVITPRDIDLY